MEFRDSSVSTAHQLRNAKRIYVSLFAALIVLVMITTSFMAVLVSGESDPEVWTDRDEYAPGETVYLFGDGFVKWVPVDIELEHPDLGTQTFSATPAIDGSFVFDGYTAEWVENPELPVNVTVTQESVTGTLVATTIFYDPGAFIEGWTLAPHLRWTKGDIKGYNEGDSVPMSVVLSAQHLGDIESITIDIGFDFIDINSPTNPTYGIDYLTEYWDPTPDAPFNTYTNSSDPFYIHPSEGTISYCARMPNEPVDEGGNQYLQVWRFTVDLAEGYDIAIVRFGAHLALSSEVPSGLGASYYPGSALHVRMVMTDPPTNEGHRDVPIMLGDVLEPPEMTLEKECDPCLVVEGDEITFTVSWSNIGQADAACLAFHDDLPFVVDIDPTSFLYWTSLNPTKSAPSPAPVVSGYTWDWTLGYWPGTGYECDDPVVGYLSFTATVNTNEPGCYYNWVYLTYQDSHGGYYPTLEAWCMFCIISEPSVMIEKTGPEYAHVGDVITYEYTITNTGDVDLYDVVVDDPLVDDDPIAEGVTLLVGESKTYHATYEVLETDDDPLPNTATVTGEDEWGRTATDDDCWEVDILHPEIMVFKEVDPECAEIGESIWYHIWVENPSEDTDLYNVSVSDPMLDSWFVGTLLYGETYDLGWKEYTVLEDDDDPLLNEVTAVGEDIINFVVSDEASATVEIYHPMIEVMKGADKSCAEVGETVTYWIKVSNPSWDTTMTAHVVDAKLSLDETVVLEAGEWMDWTSLEYTVQPKDPDPLINTVYVVAWDCQDHMVRDSASWTIDIYHPMIEITKEADLECAAAGDEITYWINVTNPSTDTPMDAVVYDEMFGGVIWSGAIMPQTTVPLTETYLVLVGAPDPLVNTATVTAVDPQGHDRDDSATWEIEIYHPDIDIDKWADLSCAIVGETVTYWINLSNPTEDTPMYAEVYDSMFGLVYDDWISAGDYWNKSFKHTVTESDPDPLFNEVWVDALDPQDHYAYDYDCWSVDIYHPDIQILKEADKVCAAVGEEVTYTITIRNPSDDTPLPWVQVSDDMFGGIIWTGSLAPLQTIVLDMPLLTYTVQPDDPDPLINTAVVVATDPQDHMVRAASWWSVDVVHPDVMVEKIADKECAAVGEDVTYTIYVTNPQSADVWLNGTVTDDMLGQTWTFTNLVPGETLTYTYTMPMPDVDPFENTVEVVAYDHQLHEVTASDSWSVDVVHPEIHITKEADKVCAAEGEEVTYWINVTNPEWADVWLNGTVCDDTLELYWQFSDLKPGETLYFTVVVGMPVDADPFVNIAHVEAYDHQRHLVTDEASWRVDVVHPEILVDKVADKECAAVGESVKYTIYVTNPEWADVWLNGTVTDDVLGQTWSFFDLKPGETITYTYSMPMPDVDPFVNTVVVEAFDHQMHAVYARDCWTVDVVHPMIEVTKTADVTCAHIGETITYTITVTVPEECDVWMNGTVYDDDLGWVESFFDVQHGYSVSWKIPYLVTEATPDMFTNHVYVEAYDHQFHLVTDEDSWTVDILHPEILVTKIGPEKADVGETITYYVNVTNMGDTPLLNVTVYDSLMGVLAFIAMIDVGETVYLTYTYVVPAGTGTLDNIVTASGEDKQHTWVDDSAEWSVFKYGVVDGYKFADVDQDMYMDASEPGLSMWLIVLSGTTYSGEEIYWTRLTDSFGYYQFKSVDAGEYTVSEVMLTGWINIMPISSPPFEVGSGTTYACDFGNLPTGNITGYKWHDVDIDGMWDMGEPGIEGWTIYLYGYDVNGDYVSLETTTDEDGYYAFTDLLPGEYEVSEETVDGWFATVPITVYIDVSTLVPFEVTDIDFGNAKYGRITGFKWLDEYMNGYRDGDEPLLSGWTIVLEGVADDGTIVGPLYAVTDENGYYAFEYLMPGVYTITEVLQPGWTNVTPLSKEVTLIEGSEVTCVKFGNVEWGKIDGWKFLDWDMDGTKDGNEPGIPGWEITIEGWLNDGYFPLPMSMDGCTYIGPITITTDANGYWMFDHLLPGFYRVTEASVEGWFHTTPASIGFMVYSGTYVVDVKFGNVPYTCLYGWKIEDLNGNGRWDEGEPGIPGWTIYIEGVRNDGVPVYLELVTDEFGHWETCYNILPGTYWIYEEMREGWMPTSAPEIVFEPPMEMEPMAYSFAFLNFELGHICGYKYEDMNGNGILDEGDTPIQGWTITLTGPMSWSTTTDEHGYFEFDGLIAGTYTVTEETRPNWVPMTPTYYTVSIMSGSCVCLEPFLNVELSKIWGYKFEDMNSNGVWDEGEPGIEGWTIYMIWDEDDTVYWTVTGKGGYWEFDGLMPDEYYLIWEESREGWTPTTQDWALVSVRSGDCIEIPAFGNFHNVDITVFKYEDVNSNGEYDEGDVPLAGWSIVVSGPGVPGGSVTLVTDEYGYASVEVTAAGTYTVEELLQEGWCNITPALQYAYVLSGIVEPEVVMFGNFRCVTITLFKYEDVDSNGVFDGDDIPLRGWTFYLDSLSGKHLKVVTGADGTVQVTFCRYDLWTVTEEDRDGWCMVTPEDGYYSLWVLSGVVVNIELQEEQYWFEFGNFRCVEIVVFKYWDKCSNGWYDPGFGDEPIEGWYMELYGPDGALIASGYTDEYGYINWTVCRAGTYIVVEEDREGWSHITPLSGYYEIEVLSGDRQLLAYFGNYLDVDIPIFKYEDVNSNGEYDEGDRPLGDWYFEAVRDDGTVYSGYTDGTGMLILTVNRSGMYTIYEEMPAGWTAIDPETGMRLVNVVSGTEVPTQMFGNFHDVTITVFKFQDMDGDGCYDDEDTPLEGWEFMVTGPWSGSGTIIVTGADGYASVVVDRAGLYYVDELVQAGWTPTTATHAELWLMSGCEPNTILFGNFKDVEITVFKYEDVNSNGVYDEGIDRPLAGWTIEAYSMDYGGYLTAVTGADGYATIVLTKGGLWEIYEYLQEGWCQITPGQGSYWYEAYSGDVPDVFEFGNFRCVVIDVFKYEDVNSNGVYDKGDVPVEGWYFELFDSAGALHAYGWTGADGHLYFFVCHYDLWTVVEENREGWTHINPECGSLTVETPSSAEPDTLMFGNFRDVWIVVFKYHDVNSNGIYDEGDYALSDWMFSISGPGVTDPVAYTDGYGYAYFRVTMAGLYTVTEEDRAGWVHVNPVSGVLQVSVVSGDEPNTLCFGNFQVVRIWVFKYDDILANGWYCPDEGDKPLEGWRFELYKWVDDGWVLVAVNYTDEEGYASFLIESAGTYMIVEELPTGWMCITYEDGMVEFRVLGGMQSWVIEFGNFKLGKIFGWKWNDLNGNGEWDEGEPALSGWKIWFECVDPYYLTGFTYTNAEGYYEFTGLPSGVYWVWEVGQAGWIPTSPPEVMVEIIGHTEARVDFFNFELGCVWGYKYEDMNGNGRLDEGDVPLAGWTIYLLDATGKMIAMTTTDGDGYYAFCNLGPGLYTVSEEARTGWIATNDDSESFVMTSGAMISIHTFLNFELGCICGYKFEDLNSNGEWDEGEPAIEDWEIYMIYDGDPTEYVTHTDEYGFFVFSGLRGGEYLIWEEFREDWTPTTQDWALVTVYSGDCIGIPAFGNFHNVGLTLFKYEDVDGNGVFNGDDVPIEDWMFTVTGPCFDVPLVLYTDEYGYAYAVLTMAGEYLVVEEDREGWMHVVPEDGTATVDIMSGYMLKTLMFGNFKLGEITGQKFYDWNLNGLKDGAEPGLANWVIWINGTLVGGGWLNFTRLTDSNGLYSVAGLPAGTYVVSERLEYAPAGWVPMTPTTVTVDMLSGTAAGVSFGNAVFGVIEGYKFYDKNLDGFRDEGEPGLSGWTIVLEGYTDQGVYVYRTDVTNATGKYVFEEVQPGEYDVYEVLWPDWAPTTPLPVHISVSGAMVYFDVWVDIGNVRYATVYGWKFLDTYSECYPYWPNGLFDEDEWGLGNWEITLQGWTNTGEYVDRVQYTDNYEDVGYYEFGELLPGTYWVNETLQYGFYATRPISNLIIIYPFPMGPVQIRIDFGNMLPTPDPEVKFVLKQGVNMWSSPLVMSGGLMASELAAAIGPTLLKVSKFDAATQTYTSFLPGINKPGSVYDFPIVLGAGYFVVTSADTVFTLVGDLPADAVGQLGKGVNLMGYTELEPTTASELAASITGAKVYKISYYNPETGKYTSFLPGINKPGSIYDFTVTPGRAYFVVTDGPASVYFAQATG